ncbi:MAG: hypothetical protein RIN55_00795 [Tissierellaceae bacterium]|nr:hypothetical protein [Tissierellaceae bacterium]
MREKIEKFVESAFSIFTIIAVIGGGIVFVMFVLGIIIGGPTGTSLAVNAKSVVMPIFIRCAAVAVLAGLIHYYATGKHALTMDEHK